MDALAQQDVLALADYMSNSVAHKEVLMNRRDWMRGALVGVVAAAIPVGVGAQLRAPRRIRVQTWPQAERWFARYLDALDDLGQVSYQPRDADRALREVTERHQRLVDDLHRLQPGVRIRRGRQEARDTCNSRGLQALVGEQLDGYWHATVRNVQNGSGAPFREGDLSAGSFPAEVEPMRMAFGNAAIRQSTARRFRELANQDLVCETREAGEVTTDDVVRRPLAALAHYARHGRWPTEG